jgi:hypothetical protein
MIVDIDDEFRRGVWRIEKYWYRMEEYVIERTENIFLVYEFRPCLFLCKKQKQSPNFSISLKQKNKQTKAIYSFFIVVVNFFYVW